MKLILFVVTVTCFLLQFTTGTKIDVRELKCLVCKKTIHETDLLVQTLDPNVRVDMGSYRLDASGNVKTKTVSQRHSEIQISELLDSVCPKMEDYVRATWKHTGKLTLIKLIEDGKMSTQMSEVDLIQDADLNKSLKYYCESLIEEFEDEIIKRFIEGDDNGDEIANDICTNVTSYCTRGFPTDEL